MYKNQLQELAQRSCFNLPSYSCIREGPDHAPRFKATVNFNGETFESPTFCSTLRHAEHAAAEVALSTLANRGPSRALAARVLDETGVYKNLVQETAHRAGLNLPVYTTVRSGPGHVPVFSSTVELAGMRFSGEPAKTKKQAQKNAAMAAWSSLKQLAQRDSSSFPLLESESSEEQEQVLIARVLASLRPTEANNSTQNDSQDGHQRSISMHSNSSPVAPSLYSMGYKNWDHSSFSAEMLMYQMWQQAHLLQLQSRLLPLPFPPAPPLVPHILPFMHPAIRPDPHLYCPTRELETTTFEPGTNSATLSPSFYISNSSIPGSVRGRSMVTIQEIQEEKTEKSSNICPAQVINPLVFGDREVAQEEKKLKGDGLEAKIGASRQPEGNPTRQFEWMPQRSMDSGPRPVNFPSQKSHAFDFSQLNLRSPPPRGTRPPSVASHNTAMGSASSSGPRPRNLSNQMPRPFKVRTGASPCLSKPRMEFGGVPNRFMAPAVQIRSVVPVCSAPPARKLPITSDRGQVPDEEVKNTGQQAMLVPSSELSKLHI